jgi:hypothetical protein
MNDNSIDILKLFSGVGVIIDDALADSNSIDVIWKIKKHFEDRNFPVLSYKELPSNENVSNFHSVSFLLLDWDLYGNLPIGISKPQTATDDNIAFIKQFNSVCFAPIFIFSNENTDDIKNKLESENLYDTNKSNHIFVESKSNVKQAKTLFSKIKKWLQATPSMYVLKEWEQSVSTAKHDLLWDFYSTNSNWTNILKQTFKTDGVDENHELTALIYKNLIARTNPPEYNEKILNKNIKNIPKEDIRKVLECERFLKNNKLSDVPATGDIFKEEYQENGTTKYKYWLNIRPDCDIARNTNPELYCLKGRIIDETKINKKQKDAILFSIKDGNGVFEEKINHALVAFIEDGKIIEFLFRDIKVKKWNDIKNSRIGRLLPPYIIRLQQKYSFYLQRQGLPAIPEKAIL